MGGEWQLDLSMANCYFIRPKGMQHCYISFFMLLISNALLILARHRSGYSVEHMQTLASVVTPRERKMLGALFAVGTEGSISSVMGNNTAGVQRAPKLPDMSNQRNRVNPYRSPQTWGRKP